MLRSLTSPASVSHCGGDGGDNDDDAASVAVAEAGYKLQLLAEDPNSCLQTILPRFWSYLEVAVTPGVLAVEKEPLTVLNH